MTLSARAATLHRTRSAFLARFGDYYDLGKPRIMYLLLLTTLAAMLMAARGLPSLSLLGWTMLGGALAAMSAGTFNCIYDADIDRVMRRTQLRPIPDGRISIFAATTHAVLLGVLSFCIFYFRVNALAAWLSLAGNVYYVVIYTMWLKRRTPQNIVIGGAAGAIPALVGWAAVTHTLSPAAIGLFAIIFLWTPPHFWALALIAETDYAKARIPMLPNVVGEDRTKRAILIYTALLVGVSLTLFGFGIMGAIYFAGAAALGIAFVLYARRLWDGGAPAARSLFRFSLVYLALLSVFMVIDRIV